MTCSGNNGCAKYFQYVIYFDSEKTLQEGILVAVNVARNYSVMNQYII